MELNYIECLAAIITYNPGISKLKRNIEAIFSLQDKIDILIVDNASKNIDDILTLISAYNSVQIIKNEKNEGIAYALNQAAQEAEERGLKWVLTCDQDSVMPSNSLSEYKKAFDIDDVALVCPIVYDSNAGRYLDYKKTNESFTEVKGCITSGSLVKVNAWRDVDGFDADMFIDGVDFDFCYRLCEKGYKIIRVNSVILTHEIGKIKTRHFLWKKVLVHNHNSFRKYYIMRNRVYSDYKHYKKRRLKTYLFYFKFRLIILLYEEEKKEKLKAVHKGFKDGKVMGRKLLKK